MTALVIPYKPRDVFVPYHANTKRFSITVAHRRCGKTVARLNKIIKAAVTDTKQNPRYAYLCPYYVQAKDIAWQYLKHYTAPLAPLGVKYREDELSITFGHNNAVIRLYGAENAERMRGLYFDGIAPDEAQGINAATLRTIILPCLADRQGWLDVSGTPKGRGNLLADIYQEAQDNPGEWFLQVLKASETRILPDSELALQRRRMSENEYRQEYECDFDAAITGAVYGKQMSWIEDNGRIVNDLWDKTLPVHTAWDLGYSDATAIWFFQIVRGEVRLIDYEEDNGQPIDHYAGIINAKPYSYGDHYGPHDANNKLLAAGGKSIAEQLLAYGIRMKVVPATSQANQIEALRLTLGSTWIDGGKCAKGIAALKQYQFKWDDERKTFNKTPYHSWASHGADAAEIIGQVWRDTIGFEDDQQPQFFPNVLAKDVFALEDTEYSPRERARI